jgi:hypothetical protein
VCGISLPRSTSGLRNSRRKKAKRNVERVRRKMDEKKE